MKKGIKKLVALSTVAVMAASLAACGSSSSSTSTSGSNANSASSASSASSAASTSSASGSSAKADGNYKLAYIHQHMTNSFQIAIQEGLKSKAEELGMTLQEFDADQDAATQISQIEQCISEGYDAIAFEPVVPDGLVDAAHDIVDAGIVCINAVSTVTGWEEFVDGYAGASNVEAGEAEMTEVVDLIGGKGEIAILTGPEGDSGALDRYQGYMNVLENYPDVKVVAESACDWDTALAQSTVESWKVAYPDLVAIVAENDGMAVGAGNVYGADSGVVITGVDASEDGLEAIADGRQTGTVAQDAKVQGELVVQLAYDLLTGAKTGKGNSSVCDNVWVNADNLEAYQNGELSE